MFKWIARIILGGFTLLLVLGVGFGGGVLVDRYTLVQPVAAQAQSLPTSSPLDLSLLTQAYQIIQKNYVDQSAIQPTQLIYGAISGMVSALGDTGHSRFMTPEMIKEENTQTSGEFEGIGAEVTINNNGQVVVVAPIDGSPAQKAGVKAGDIIIKVDGVDVSGMSLQTVVDKVLGPAGTKVTLTLQDPASNALRDVTITRAKVQINNVSWQMLPGSTIAHVRIAEFSNGVTKDLQQALQAARQQGATGVILDLRNNPGGLLSEAVGVASQFLSSGNVLQVRDAQGKVQDIAVEKGGVATDLPVVVLINQGTASAAEIVSGALQDAGRARLLGETTFGTGTVLNDFPLSDGSEVLLATQEWLTPKGRLIWHQGIQPDVAVTLPENVTPLTPDLERQMTATQLQTSQDIQLLRAVQLLTQS